MKVFVTDASGFVGTPLLEELRGHGVTILALARSDGSAQKLEAAGFEVQRGPSRRPGIPQSWSQSGGRRHPHRLQPRLH